MQPTICLLRSGREKKFQVRWAEIALFALLLYILDVNWWKPRNWHRFYLAKIMAKMWHVKCVLLFNSNIRNFNCEGGPSILCRQNLAQSFVLLWQFHEHLLHHKNIYYASRKSSGNMCFVVYVLANFCAIFRKWTISKNCSISSMKFPFVIHVLNGTPKRCSNRCLWAIHFHRKWLRFSSNAVSYAISTMC